VKVEAARAALNAINPDVEVVALHRRVKDFSGLVKNADVVLDCSDNFATRHALNRACVRAKRPLVSGAAIRFDAQLAVFDLRKPDAPCYACIYPEDGEVEEPALPLGFAGSEVTAETVAFEEPRSVDEGWVVVQPDGVITHAQKQTGKKRLESYTAVVLLAGLSFAFAAATPQELIVEVAGLLAALGVHEGKRKLLFVADGARCAVRLHQRGDSDQG
jgi:molybdopterin/thiamine biosynthesis adenylyltransferase